MIGRRKGMWMMWRCLVVVLIMVVVKGEDWKMMEVGVVK